MIKEIIIITLIILLIYAYYQQNQPHILEDSPENKSLIKDLKGQVQHYQNLYQKRVAHDLDKNSVEIQTDNFIGESKETQTPFTLKYSRTTQTDLSDKQISLLTQQWNQVANWAKELGIDINKTWNLGIVKEKLKGQLETVGKKNNLVNQELLTAKNELSNLQNKFNSLQVEKEKKDESLEKVEKELASQREESQKKAQQLASSEAKVKELNEQNSKLQTEKNDIENRYSRERERERRK